MSVALDAAREDQLQQGNLDASRREAGRAAEFVDVHRCRSQHLQQPLPVGIRNLRG